jgi:hypothetical protein
MKYAILVHDMGTTNQTAYSVPENMDAEKLYAKIKENLKKAEYENPWIRDIRVTIIEVKDSFDVRMYCH